MQQNWTRMILPKKTDNKTPQKVEENNKNKENLGATFQGAHEDTVVTSAEARKKLVEGLKKLMTEQEEEAIKAKAIKAIEELDEDESADPVELKMLQELVEVLTGKKLRVKGLKKLLKQHQENRDFGERFNNIASRLESVRPKFAERKLDSFESDYRVEKHTYQSTHIESTHYEAESMSFNTAGVVHTADGAEIKIELNLNMDRKFASHTELASEKLIMIDPLVINFNGNFADLTQKKIHI